jgi:hypothetical protein
MWVAGLRRKRSRKVRHVPGSSFCTYTHSSGIGDVHVLPASLHTKSTTSARAAADNFMGGTNA